MVHVQDNELHVRGRGVKDRAHSMFSKATQDFWLKGGFVQSSPLHTKCPASLEDPPSDAPILPLGIGLYCTLVFLAHCPLSRPGLGVAAAGSHYSRGS